MKSAENSLQNVEGSFIKRIKIWSVYVNETTQNNKNRKSCFPVSSFSVIFFSPITILKFKRKVKKKILQNIQIKPKYENMFAMFSSTKTITEKVFVVEPNYRFCILHVH